MIRFLPFLLIPILLIAGLGFWRYSANKQELTDPQDALVEEVEPVEVPKTLPGATLEDRVKNVEETVLKLAAQTKKSPSPSSGTPTGLEARLGDAEAAITELKARVSALEKASPAPASVSSKATIYIPLGAGGSWADFDWKSLPEYEISLNPDNYPGYSGMSLEVNFRLVESAGTGSVRLYNETDKGVTSGELSSTSTSFALQSTQAFKLASGTKTYRLQVKSTQGKDLFIQSARIKVSF